MPCVDSFAETQTRFSDFPPVRLLDSVRQPPPIATTNPHNMEKVNCTVQRAAPQKCQSPSPSLRAPLSQGLLQSIRQYLHAMPGHAQQFHPPVFDLQQQLMTRLQEEKQHLQLPAADELDVAAWTWSRAGGKGRLPGVSACCSLLR